MRKSANRWIALATLAVMTCASLGGFGMATAHAGSKSRRNLMLGAAAVTGYGLLTHRRSLAVAGAIGTGIAYHNYRAAKKREERYRHYRHHHRYRVR